MDVQFHLFGLDFEWDSQKALTNEAKHGVSFEEAAEVFFDPFARIAETGSEVEQRYFILGYSELPRLLLVVHTERTANVTSRGVTRIISARPATPSERRQYERG